MSIVLSVNISKIKGISKKPVEKATAIKNYGIFGDAHAFIGSTRQISLLNFIEIGEFDKNLPFGIFAENITISGISSEYISIGSILKIGNVIIKITQIGKTCHSDCNIKKMLGSCIMPQKGIFGVVLSGGIIRPQMFIEVLNGKYFLCK
ncbi:MOSC domain-containing protein [Desulfurella sp.]|uniref:MOSC domain-containing protein n=1 Tax=Desulfurella sp. TaxID=1962857 RepID=UPI0025BBAE7D|nr:MOSC domain-containing protein [Desulfurella sp.]